MRRSSVVCFLLFVVYCFCISDSRRVRPTRSTCGGRWRQFCLASAVHVPNDEVLSVGGESEIRVAREVRERREVGEGGRIEREGEREGDDLQRPEINDQRRQQLSEERQLTNIGNHQQHPAQHHDVSALDRLRSLLGTRELDVDDREREEKRQKEVEEETQRRSISDPKKSVILNETMTMLEKILGDIEGRLDPSPVPHKVNKKSIRMG